MRRLFYVLAFGLLFSCNTSAQKNETKTAEEFPITKTEAEWKKQLTSEQFYVLRKAGTERPFTSPLNKEYRKGTFHCVACDTPLFKSEHKFDSGTGWPSFDREIKGNVEYSTDYNVGYARTEEHCATCGGHLGHVFGDGPRNTTGKRHCINGVALKFVPEG
ncbi:peptide-methionine (R)-S-oxide reductase MsrB [Psychroserpens sp.]|uniref:peptide-methionine (R)-S-oxide reductase MsrB n=1 Tax=Psychroserpens sp. TaxID=2020870 RepID=UPI001AFD9A82|nr:peptide-methionine (R)-S-oxide reductase MsrB [Psychroserpens sp.]MBO6607290.1 peptide-methionine (R)-S-oxide reductase MsrB [Psychroserpens sp.]MBO6631388.1 peptide-methionine (R)-S-oxide reductase MsrB [Psychroserpens sp.]MBO6654634.1 peptide-methionine (R)-S-oxide reductase MsrB [Psychroserpens sp.]MBO6681019.1 peptide-methionine (R)-S-oxide reductase MsrB [Psychroserpens sp.]MBO6750026.1 peptide-methionine (R)-S-oxide reductase MsrB [Psychroserpens sp.]